MEASSVLTSVICKKLTSATGWLVKRYTAKARLFMGLARGIGAVLIVSGTLVSCGPQRELSCRPAQADITVNGLTWRIATEGRRISTDDGRISESGPPCSAPERIVTDSVSVALGEPPNNVSVFISSGAGGVDRPSAVHGAKVSEYEFHGYSYEKFESEFMVSFFRRGSDFPPSMPVVIGCPVQKISDAQNNEVGYFCGMDYHFISGTKVTARMTSRSENFEDVGNALRLTQDFLVASAPEVK